MTKGERLIPIEQADNETERFCNHQIYTHENPNGLDCSILIIEGISAVTGQYECPYQSAEHAKEGNHFARVTKGGDGVCRDFKEIETSSI